MTPSVPIRSFIGCRVQCQPKMNLRPSWIAKDVMRKSALSVPKKLAVQLGVLVLLGMGIVGVLSFTYLMQSVGWQKTTIITTTIGALVALEVVALKVNSRKGNPLPRQAIIVVFLVAMGVVLTLVV